MENPVSSPLGLAELLHDRTRDFNAGVRNQVIELLANELKEAEWVVEDLLLTLAPNQQADGDDTGQIELREVVDDVAQELATSNHLRVAVSGHAQVRADPAGATQVIRNMLRCVAACQGEDTRVQVGSGFNKVFVEVSYIGETPFALPEEGQAHDIAQARNWHPYSLAISTARALARRLGGDLTASHGNTGGTFELSLPKALGPYRGKMKIADSIFDPDPDGPTKTEVSELIESGGPDMVFQPIFDIREDGRDAIVGYEALARFAKATPPEWLEAAGHVGSRLDLELAAIRSAIAAFSRAGEAGFLAVNVSDPTLLSPELPMALYGLDGGLIVVELSEAGLIKSYQATTKAMGSLRDRSVRLAVDNVGAGEIDLWSILHLQPEIIKIDMSLVRDIASSPMNRALVRGLTAMAADLGAMAIAEGVETLEEREVLEEAGVEFAQGFLLGTPHHLPCNDSSISE